MLSGLLSTALDNFSNPEHPLHHPGQLLLVSGLAYAGTAILNATWIISTPPLHGMAFMVLAFAIRKVIAPILAEYLKAYEKDTLAPKAYRFTCWLAAELISKYICMIFGMHFKISQMVLINLSFFLTYRAAQTGLKKMRESLSLEPISKMPRSARQTR